MDTIKSLALTLIVIAASLMLLLTSVYDRGKPMVNHGLLAKQDLTMPTDRERPSSFEYEQSTEIGRIKSPPIEPDKVIIITSSATTIHSNDLPLTLYPELARIVELENQAIDTAFSELVPMLSDDDPVIRLAALESLADMSHPYRLSMLTAALDDPNPLIRITALEALTIKRDEVAVSSIEPYVYDREPEVRMAAIEALAVLENEAAVPTLAGLLADQDPLIRQQAVNALGEIGGEYAIPYLLQARYDSDETIRVNADAILKEIASAVIY